MNIDTQEEIDDEEFFNLSLINCIIGGFFRKFNYVIRLFFYKKIWNIFEEAIIILNVTFYFFIYHIFFLLILINWFKLLITAASLSYKDVRFSLFILHFLVIWRNRLYSCFVRFFVRLFPRLCLNSYFLNLLMYEVGTIFCDAYLLFYKYFFIKRYIFYKKRFLLYLSRFVKFWNFLYVQLYNIMVYIGQLSSSFFSRICYFSKVNYKEDEDFAYANFFIRYSYLYTFIALSYFLASSTFFFKLSVYLNKFYNLFFSHLNIKVIDNFFNFIKLSVLYFCKVLLEYFYKANFFYWNFFFLFLNIIYDSLFFLVLIIYLLIILSLFFCLLLVVIFVSLYLPYILKLKLHDLEKLGLLWIYVFFFL